MQPRPGHLAASLHVSVFVLSSYVMIGCGSNETAVDAGSDATLDVLAPGPWRGCDPIVPEACGLPFPSDVYTAVDSTTATGVRLHFEPGSLPRLTRTVAPFEALDGFSPASSPMTLLPGASADGLVGQRAMGDSLLPGSLTVLYDLTSEERVAHFAEVDQAYPDDDQRVLFLRPSRGLTPGHRYAVAIRGVLDGTGTPIAPSPVFLALRDGTPSDDPAVLERRDEYDALLGDLAAAGVERGTLQIAWSFTVGSREAITGSLLHMRDETLDALGTAGARYTLDSVEAAPAEDVHVALRVRGTLHVPSYLTQAAPGGVLRRDAAGLPLADGELDVPFWMVVPRSAATSPAQLVQWGHGLLGSGEEILYYDALHAFLDAVGYVMFAIDWTGMAAEDIPNLLTIANRGDMGDFVQLTDRLQQGILNALVAARTMRGSLAADPAIALEGSSPIDTDREVVFVGQSQGGILGGTYMSLTTDVSRGVLMVPGQGYSFLLQRNRGGWDQFSPVFERNYGPIEIQQCLALMQLLWDHAEPSGFTPYLRNDRFEGTPPHEVLMVVAINDHQVTPLAAHAMARTIGGVPILGPVNRSIFGLTEATGTLTGSSMIEIDFGVVDVPDTNTTPPEGPDPHTMAGDPAWVFPTVYDFLTTGSVTMPCDGACDPD